MYDSIVIGSGPIAVLEAVYLSKQGKKVLLLEQFSQLGGAWGTVQKGNLPPLEIGCHIWDHDKDVYAFFKDNLGIQTVGLKPSPQIIYSKTFVPYRLKTLIFFMRKFFLGKKAKRETISRKQLKLLPITYQYPFGGATELMDKLMMKLSQTTVEVKKDERAADLNFENDTVKVTTQKESYTSKEVVLTSLTNIDSVSHNGEKKALDTPRKIVYAHAHLVVRGNTKARKFSYLRLMKDEVIHRISDITVQLKYQKKELDNQQVFIVGIYESAKANLSEEILKERIVAKLKSLKLLAKEATVLAVHFNEFPAYYTAPESAQLLKQKGKEKLRILHSTNLIFGINKQLDRWKNVV